MRVKPGEGGEQRRRSRRLEVALPLWLRGKDADGVPFEDSTISYNLSREGASFRTNLPLEVGQQLDLIIPRRLPGREGTSEFVTTGVVRRVMEKDLGEFEVGIEFTGPRLRTYIPESA